MKDLSRIGARSSLARVAWVVVCALALVAPAAPAVAVDESPSASREQRPAPVTVRTLRPDTAPGLLFVAAQSPQMAYLHGPQILDNQGRPIWFREVPEGSFATSFRVQTYRGQEVLAWWEGGANSSGQGWGTGYIADRNYRIIATVRGHQSLDFHEFRLTPQGTALVMLTRETPFDLTPIGGPADGAVWENGFQEIDVATGAVVREWWSLDHVPITETHWVELEGAMNYFHMNSVALDVDGHYLVSGRHTSTVYKVHRRTGEIIWRLGGKNSDFKLGDGAGFSWQHDASADGRNTYRIFDNATSPMTMPGKESRVVWLKVDPVRRVATLLRDVEHPDALSVGVEGGSQTLLNRNTIVSWGSAGRVSEFTAGGALVFDATLPERHSTYRAYRFPWQGRPLTDPTVTLAEDGATVRAVWNGATGVARWRVLGGRSEKDLKPLVVAAWNGLDTSITLPSGVGADLDYLKVQALDDRNTVIGASPVTPTGH